MAELIRINDNSGIWRIKPHRKKKPSDLVVGSLETIGYYGNAIGSYKGSYLEGDIIFKIDKKNYSRTEIFSSESVSLGAIEWRTDALKNINWKSGPLTCSLKGFRPYQINKRYDSLLDPHCNIYYDFFEKDRLIATTTLDFHSFFKLRNPPPRFDSLSQMNDDLNSWLVALISLYVYSIDRRYQAKPM